MGNPSPSGYRQQSKVSPLKRIRVARGVSVEELAYRAGVAQVTLRKIDKLDPETIGGLKIENLMRVALVLECSPMDLVPFLGTRVKGKGKIIARKNLSPARFKIGDERSVEPTRGFGSRDT